MERERAEAYKIYVSDSLALYSKILTRGEIEITRYIDAFKKTEQKPEETAEQIVSRFDKLRRN